MVSGDSKLQHLRNSFGEGTSRSCCEFSDFSDLVLDVRSRSRERKPMAGAQPTAANIRC